MSFVPPGIGIQSGIRADAHSTIGMVRRELTATAANFSVDREQTRAQQPILMSVLVVWLHDPNQPLPAASEHRPVVARQSSRHHHLRCRTRPETDPSELKRTAAPDKKGMRVRADSPGIPMVASV